MHLLGIRIIHRFAYELPMTAPPVSPLGEAEAGSAVRCHWPGLWWRINNDSGTAQMIDGEHGGGRPPVSTVLNVNLGPGWQQVV